MTSSDVYVRFGATRTLAPGARVAVGHIAGGRGGELTSRLSTSPDNYPSSIRIVEEWSYTDADGIIVLAVRYQNDGPETVVFRSKRIDTGVYAQA